jgi:DNA-directed RNA polymerase subunit L
MGIDGRAYLLVYLQFPNADHTFSPELMATIKIKLDTEKVRAFAASLGHPIPDNVEITLKGGLNMAYLIDQVLQKKLEGKVTWAAVRSAGLDGASANFGENTGLVTWINRIRHRAGFGPIIGTHCFAHQLSLVCKHSSDSVPYLCFVFEPCLLCLWIYWHYSPVRKERMDKILQFDCGQDGEVIITHAAFTRWLSHLAAIVHQIKYLAAQVLEMCSAAATAGMDPHHKAAHLGTLKTLRTFMFFATVYFLHDALQPMHTLAQQLQERGLTFREVKAHYQAAKETLTAMLKKRDEITCPSYTRLLQEVRAGKIDGRFIVELEGEEGNAMKKLSNSIARFEDEVAKPLLTNLLSRLKDRFEDSVSLATWSNLEVHI